jgi:peptidyl-prolyl cis-trans isomerase D
MFVGPFEDALFSMSPGEIRGPIKTQFGYHVIRLEQVEAGGQRSFADVHDELEAEYRKDRAQNGFYEESQKLGDQAFAALTELDSVAKAMTLPIKQVPGFTREGGGELGNDPSIIEAAFSEDVLEKRQNSVLVPVGEDRALVLRVVAHKPSEPRPLAEVRAQIEARLKVQAAREAATKKGTDALAKLKGGEAWSAVTTQANLKPVGKRSVTRQDSVAPPAVVRTAFKAPKTAITADKPYYEGVATDDGNYAIVAVSAVRTAPANTETPEQKTARQKQAERQLGVEEFAAYIAEAESNADVVKNEKVFE